MLKLSSEEIIDKNPRMFLQCSKCDAHLKMGETFDIPKCSCGGDTQIMIDNNLINLSMDEILEQVLGCSIDSLRGRTFSNKDFIYELLGKSSWTFEEICALTVLIVITSYINEPQPLEAYNFGLAIGLVNVLDEQMI